MHEAYQPVIDDGRGRFPEDLRVKAPRGARAAIAAAAQLKHTSHSEYVRQAILRCLDADGVKLRRGTVEVQLHKRIEALGDKIEELECLLAAALAPSLISGAGSIANSLINQYAALDQPGNPGWPCGAEEDQERVLH